MGEPSILHLPRPELKRTPLPGGPHPRLRQGAGAAGPAPSPFFLFSPQPRPRRSYPASRLPESPATAAVPSRPADSSSDLVQELSQDTHCLPGPPPRSRFRCLLAESQKLGEALREMPHHYWPGWQGRGERKNNSLATSSLSPSPFRLPGDPY